MPHPPNDVCRGRKIAMDVARGMDKMHSRHIIHLDLKSPNILLTASGTAKIAVRSLFLPLQTEHPEILVSDTCRAPSSGLLCMQSWCPLVVASKLPLIRPSIACGAQ